MKVKQLIEQLLKADPEMDVCIFSDQGVISPAEWDVAIYSGEYNRPYGNKLIYQSMSGKYVGLGHPGDFDDLISDSVVHLEEVLYEM